MRAEEGTDMFSSDPEAMKTPYPAACDLIPNETLLYRTHFHWIIMFWPAVLAILFSLLGVVALIALPARGGSTEGSSLLAAVGLFSVVVAAAISVIAYLRWESREVILTNRRLILISGTIGTQMGLNELEGVESATLRQNLLGKVLGYGTVVAYQAGGSVRFMKTIPRAEKLYLSLQAQLNPGSEQKTNSEAD
jgi:hypothetical protein